MIVESSSRPPQKNHFMSPLWGRVPEVEKPGSTATTSLPGTVSEIAIARCWSKIDS